MVSPPVPPFAGLVRSVRRRAALLAAGVLAAPAVLAAPSGGASADLAFTNGVRWSAAAEAAAPWVPTSVAFTGDGQFVWSAPAFGTPSLQLHPTVPLAAGLAPLRVDAGLGAVVGTPLVAAGASSSFLFALTQTPAAIPGLRRTRLARYDANTANFVPVWTDDASVLTNAAALCALADDGSRLVRGLSDPATGRLHLEWLDAASGLSQGAFSWPAAPLRELAVSSDGTRAACLVGARLLVCDASGSALLDVPLGTATRALALAGDGLRVLAGDVARVRVFAADSGGSAFTEVAAILGAPSEVPTRAALDALGRTAVAAWWDAANGQNVRLVVRDESTLTQVLEASQIGSPTGLQNFPVALRISSDGERIAWGLWGVGDSRPEVLLFQRSQAAPLLGVDLPGSVLELALDLTGTRVAVAAKSAHANTFTNLGAVHLLDSGERDLELLSQPVLAGSLQVAARHPGANLAIFALGHAADVPTVLSGVAGAFWLDPAQGWRTYVRPVGADGRADLCLPLPAGAGLAGADLAVQAAFRIGGATLFSETCVVPVLLP